MTISTLRQPQAILTLKSVTGREVSIEMEHVSAEMASTVLNFPAEILTQLHHYGIIAGEHDQVDLGDAARIVSTLRAVQAPHVGQPILISDAARKYGFNTGSIYNWVLKGWVKVLIDEPKRQIDEGDIALARAIADLQGHVPGRAVFPARPRSGRPLKKK